MTKIRYGESAIFDLMIAKKIIREFFIAKNSPELAKLQLDAFVSELKEKVVSLKTSPELYPRRFYSASTGLPVHSFSCHWFIVFYTYNKEINEVIIMFIRSSKSDYSNIVYLV